jgi:hypothetical protein
VLQLEVLASAALARGVPETEQLLRSTGQALFAGLLGADGIVGCYRASAALAAERGEDLRVVLRIDDPVLAGLPWEAMFDRETGAYVCCRDQLVRHVPVASAPAPLQVRLPLRILGVVSSPSDLHRLDADAEKRNLARAVAGLASQGLAEVHWAPDATWAGLQDLLMDGEWHVLHYIGHGSFDPGRDDGVLALERPDGRADLVSAGRMVDLLRRARPMPRLVILNSCASAATGVGDLFSGTAAALVRGGVPAVAAMQYKITDGAAIAFARGFYASIARGRGVDDAVSSGRVGILGLGDKTLEWVTPVLYLRGHETRLFTLPASTADRSRDNTGTENTSTARRQLGGTINPTATDDNPTRDRPVDHAATHALQPQVPQNDSDPRTRNDEAAADGSRADDPGITRASRERIRAFLRVMADIAGSVTDGGRKARAQGDVARAAAGADPHLAVAIARSITHTYSGQPIDREQALAGIACVVAATDPDLAVDIAGSSSDDNKRVWAALAGVACVVAATDPDRAMDIVKPITGRYERQNVISRLAPIVAPASPERGERMARSVAHPATRASVLANVARAVTATDPDRAALLTAEAVETVGRLPDEEKIWWILGDVAQAVAATQPDRAVSLVSPIRDQSEKASALTAVAQVVAPAHPDRAEQIARSITSYETDKSDALVAVAQAAAPAHPDRAEQIARSITDNFYASMALSGVAQALAADQPGRAERIAWLATVERDKVKALACVAHAVAATDPGQAAALTAYLAETADQLASEGEVKALAEFTSAVAATHPALAEQQAGNCLNAIGQATDETLRINVLSLLCAAMEAITTPTR